MTPKKRAEKITRWIDRQTWDVSDIAAKIEEAEKYARAEGCQDAIKRIEAIKEEAIGIGFRAAQEKAAEIAQTYVIEPTMNEDKRLYRDRCTFGIAERIREMVYSKL